MARGIPPQSLQTSSRVLKLELELELMARCSHTPPPPSICQGGRRCLPQSRIGSGAQTKNDSQTRIDHDDTTLAWRQRASAYTGGPAQSLEHKSDLLPYATAHGWTSPRRV
ncbi:hypothetical protein A9Z42_0046140 [Trichoderma parareesei]|uniref:Uncharacterized protein n=1 Tax=Trichoderma parareesei TaxID=858221 RepID=A0A2H2ZLL9_TRIPA|nr:hypothetical protein A9Z42_0046140 [Trichoderma parareesei]